MRFFISDHFEKLWQESKTNSFDPKALLQHIECGTHKPHAQALRKALEEIAVRFRPRKSPFLFTF